MPHLRRRYLEKALRSDLKWSRVVSVLGMRQCGKTTLIKGITEQYCTLDDVKLFDRFEAGDWALIDGATPTLAIDEAQRSERLFYRVKLKADQSNRPGLFLLTGSVRFLARDVIKESLTGRTSILELLPFTISEAHNRGLFDFCGTVINGPLEVVLKKIEAHAWASVKQVKDHCALGGMPGICFKRDIKTRLRMWSAHLETVLTRDIKLLLNTKISFDQLLSLYRIVAQSPGASVNSSEAARKLGLSAPTIKKVLGAFEALFLIRRVSNLDGSGRASKIAYYCEDLGLSSFVVGGLVRYTAIENMKRFVFNELFAQLNYQHRDAFTLKSFETRGGAYVPFVIEMHQVGELVLLVDAGEGASDKSLQSLTAYKKRHPKKRVVSIVLHQGKSGYISPGGVLCLPWTWIA